MIHRVDQRITLIMIFSIAFAAVEWGGQGVKFGVTILAVAFIAFEAGRRFERR